MTSYLWLSLLVTCAAATTYRGGYRRNYDDGGDLSSYNSASSYKTPSGSAYSSFGDGRSSGSKRDYNSGFDGDDYVPPIGIQHNNDYSALGDGYQGYAGGGGGSGAISYSHVVSEHRPVQRTLVGSNRDGYTSPSHINHRIIAEPTNFVEKPVPFHVKVPLPVVPAFDRPLYPIVNLAPVTSAVIAPVKYPIQFFKPFSYLAPEKHSQALPKSGNQPQYVLTKVPLVYHASYSETPLGQSGIHASNINHNFNAGADTFNRQFNPGSFNHNFISGGHNFNAGSHNFNTGGHHFNVNPPITTPGTPSFNNFNPPTPLVPTPTPYHHSHHNN